MFDTLFKKAEKHVINLGTTCINFSKMVGSLCSGLFLTEPSYLKS